MGTRLVVLWRFRVWTSLEVDVAVSGTFVYDLAERMTSLTDRDGRRRDFSYDELDRVTTEKWYNTAGTYLSAITTTRDVVGRALRKKRVEEKVSEPVLSRD